MPGDLRYAVRSFVKTPSFSVIIVLTLALGIGANTAIFSVLHAVLLRPFPYEDAASILRVRRGTSHPDMLDWIERARGVSAIGGFRPQTFDHSAGDVAERLDGVLVTGDLLRLFGARVIAGRSIGRPDDRVGGERVVVISEHLWRTRFGSDPAVVTRQILLNDVSYTVIGILPADFALPGTTADIYAAFLPEAPREAQFRGAHTLRAFVRLAPGFTIAQAQQEMDAIAIRLEQQYPESNRDVRFRLQTLKESVVGSFRQPLAIALATVGLVLLIACVNVANLLTARSAARRAELSIRAALGATRARLVRQLLTESIVLAVCGGLMGLVVGSWIIAAIVALAPADVPRLDRVSLDQTVLAFTATLSLVTGVVFGIVPALSASGSLADTARAGTRGPVPGNRIRSLLMIAEVALALVLVVGAGLLLRSFIVLTSQELGFETRGILTANITLNGERYAGVPARTLFFEEFERRVTALPGVRSVALTTQLPIGGDAIFHNLAFEGRPVTPGTEPEVYYRGVNVAYFETFQIAFLRGRPFTSQDRQGAPLVAIVNESFGREYYPQEDPLGRRIRWASGNGEWMTIVGVVADARALSLEQGEVPAVHVPFAQEPNPWRRWMDVAVRIDGNPLALAPALRRELAAIDSGVPLTRVRSMEQVLASASGNQRFNLFLVGGFATVALLLAAAGTYGVMAYAVEQRMRELGVRLALGAQPRDIFRVIVGHALTLAAIGTAAGLVAASVSSRVLSDMLFLVPPLDWVTFTAAAGVLMTAALAASYFPARRAMRVDPLIALRSE